MLKIDIESRAEKFLLSIPIKHAKQIVAKIESYADNQKSIESKELVGHAPYFRIRSGEYRVIGKVIGDTFFVTTIGKRNGDEIYKIFEKWKR